MKTEVALNLQAATVRGVRREVLTLRTAPRHLSIVELAEDDWLIFADAGGFRRLAELFAVAATEPRRFVHVPRVWDRPDYASHLPFLSVTGLLIVHHSAQFRGGDWRELRRRLGPAQPVSRSFRFDETPPGPPYGWSRVRETDPLDIANRADTLIVTGSAPAFRRIARMLEGMSRSRKDDHGHFQDTVTMRGAYGAFRKRPTPDVICHSTFRWQRDYESDPRLNQECVWRDLTGMVADDAIRRMAEEGWAFDHRRGPEAMFRRRIV